MGIYRVYDRGKFHEQAVTEKGLPEEYTGYHIAYAVRWLIENHLTGTTLEENAETKGMVKDIRAGKDRSLELMEYIDRCLDTELLSDEGNAFAAYYFGVDECRYLNDYIDQLPGTTPKPFYVPYTDALYQALKPVIDRAYGEWKQNPPPPPEEPPKKRSFFSRLFG